MRLTKERTLSLSKSVIDRLLEENLLAVHVPKEEIIRKIEHVMTDELSVEERLNNEVKEILKTYQGEIDKGNVDYHKMFLMIKNKLVKERGLIL